MLKLWAADIFFGQLPPRRATMPAFQSDRRLKGFALVALHLSPLSSSWHSKYFATRVFQPLPFQGAVVPTLRAHPYRRTKHCELSGARPSIDNSFFLARIHYPAFFLQTRDHSLDGFVEIARLHRVLSLTSCQRRRFVDDIRQIRANESV
jgi:hypothetical protein